MLRVADMSVAPAPAILSEAELAEINERFETARPEEILAWATSRFPRGTVLTCSFQHEGVVLAHMLRSIKPDVPVLFIDTGYHFPETLEYRDTIVRLLDLPLVVLRADGSSGRGRPEDPDECCRINKVEPLQRALRQVRVWINGRRRDQTPERRNMPHVEPQGSLIKVNPLARWTARDAFRYLSAHHLPLHPLFERGYTSIGCKPCTTRPLPGSDERSGRWAGSPKRECGIHTILDAAALSPEE